MKTTAIVFKTRKFEGRSEKRSVLFGRIRLPGGRTSPRFATKQAGLKLFQDYQSDELAGRPEAREAIFNEIHDSKLPQEDRELDAFMEEFSLRELLAKH